MIAMVEIVLSTRSYLVILPQHDLISQKMKLIMITAIGSPVKVTKRW